MALTVEDQFAIQQLYARYNHAFDRGDAEDWAACFTPDGRLGEDHAGRAQIAALARHIGDARGKGRHWIGNLVLDSLAKHHATGTCYLMFVRVGGGKGPPQVVSTAVYEDELVKGPDGWRFKSRRLIHDPPAG
jgi:hypothetical protein